METYLRVSFRKLVCLGFALMFVVATADAQQATTYALTVSSTTGKPYLVGEQVTVLFTLTDDRGNGVAGVPMELRVVGLEILSAERRTDSNGELRVTVRLLSLRASLTARSPEQYAVVGIAEYCCSGRDRLTDAVVRITPSSVPSPAIAERLTLSLDIKDGENVTGYQATVGFDSSALRYVSSSGSDYLAAEAFVVPAVVKENQVTLAATSLAGASDGDGTLATLTFEVLAVKASAVTLSRVSLVDADGVQSFPLLEDGQVIEPPLVGDINGDGVVNILDLVQVAANFTETGENDADVNGDGVVDILDLVQVAGALGNAAAAPSIYRDAVEMLNETDMRQWLIQAQQFDLTDATSQRGILFLERLLAAFPPKVTALLPNYPNPFNPETWIPYQLAQAADVDITIYAANGTVVRTLDVGTQPAGLYLTRSGSAYWDGRNAYGDRVASGVYFYTLRADNFAATRKMLILK